MRNVYLPAVIRLRPIIMIGHCLIYNLIFKLRLTSYTTHYDELKVS